MGGKYVLRKDKIEVEKAFVTVYGIDYIPASGDKGISVPNISADRDKLEQHIELMNQLELSPVHLMNITEDILLI